MNDCRLGMSSQFDKRRIKLTVLVRGKKEGEDKKKRE